MEESLKMILEMEKGEKPMAMICREYGISRQTGYKWLGRYQADPCVAMLQDRDRRPHFNPRQLEGAVVELIIEARKRWPHWGRSGNAWSRTRCGASTSTGHFKYGNGETCYPLTLTDAFSRYLLAARSSATPTPGKCGRCSSLRS